MTYNNETEKDIQRLACRLVEFLTGLPEQSVIQIIAISETLRDIKVTLAEQSDEYMSNISKTISTMNMNPTVSELEILITLLNRFIVHLHREQERQRKIKSEMMGV